MSANPVYPENRQQEGKDAIAQSLLFVRSQQLRVHLCIYIVLSFEAAILCRGLKFVILLNILSPAATEEKAIAQSLLFARSQAIGVHPAFLHFRDVNGCKKLKFPPFPFCPLPSAPCLLPPAIFCLQQLPKKNDRTKFSVCAIAYHQGSIRCSI